MGRRRSLKPRLDYEELRNACITENQARMSSIGLSATISSLKKPSKPPIVKKKPTPKPGYSSVPLRRSGRVPGGIPEPESVVKEEAEEGETDEEDVKMPKKASSAFFVFLEGFRKQYQEKHPDNKLVGVVGKAGGEKWKSMSDVEKSPFVAENEKRKEKYKLYKMKLAGGGRGKPDKPMPLKKEVSIKEEVW